MALFHRLIGQVQGGGNLPEAHAPVIFHPEDGRVLLRQAVQRRGQRRPILHAAQLGLLPQRFGQRTGFELPLSGPIAVHCPVPGDPGQVLLQRPFFRVKGRPLAVKLRKGIVHALFDILWIVQVLGRHRPHKPGVLLHHLCNPLPGILGEARQQRLVCLHILKAPLLVVPVKSLFHKGAIGTREAKFFKKIVPLPRCGAKHGNPAQGKALPFRAALRLSKKWLVN